MMPIPEKALARQKKAGRRASSHDPVTAIRLSQELRENVDAWAGKQEDQPGRSEAHPAVSRARPESQGEKRCLIRTSAHAHAPAPQAHDDGLRRHPRATILFPPCACQKISRIESMRGRLPRSCRRVRMPSAGLSNWV